MVNPVDAKQITKNGKTVKILHHAFGTLMTQESIVLAEPIALGFEFPPTADDQPDIPQPERSTIVPVYMLAGLGWTLE